MLLRFCSSCGGKLPEESTVKFCPHCGAKQIQLTNAEIQPSALPVAALAGETAAAGPVKTLADVSRVYDQFIADLRLEGLDEAEIRQQAADMFARLKEQLPARPAAFGVRQSTSGALLQVDQAADYYSVVLKSSGDRERVTKRLSTVLRRGLAATRMAVDMVPGIIIYKSRENDIQAAVTILKDEQLHFCVLKGNFSTEDSVEKLIPGFAGLDSSLKLMFRQTPTALWLGERVSLVVPQIETEDKPCTLVATDQGLYIFSEFIAGRRPEWRIIPYSRLREVVLHDGRQGALELIYNQPGHSAWLQITDKQRLDQLYGHVRLALEQDS